MTDNATQCSADDGVTHTFSFGHGTPIMVRAADFNALYAEFQQLRKALAGISEEMGLPPTMGPAKGELKRLLDNGKAAIDALREAPIAISAEADFDAMTWTFRVAPDCRIGAGEYALVWMGPNTRGNRP